MKKLSDFLTEGELVYTTANSIRDYYNNYWLEKKIARRNARLRKKFSRKYGSYERNY